MASPIPVGQANFSTHLPQVFKAWEEGIIEGAPETFQSFEARVRDILTEITIGKGGCSCGDFRWINCYDDAPTPWTIYRVNGKRCISDNEHLHTPASSDWWGMVTSDVQPQSLILKFHNDITLRLTFKINQKFNCSSVTILVPYHLTCAAKG